MSERRTTTPLRPRPGLAAWLAGALLLGCASSSQVAAPPPDPAPLREPLGALAPLVGGEWVAQFPGGMSDTQRFESMVAGHFLRGVHHVRNAEGAVVYEGETVYGWDAREGGLHWWYFNSTGGFLEGPMHSEADGELVYEGENHGPGGQTERVRGSFLLDEVSAGRFTSVTWFWRDGEWQVERELVYVRAGDPAGHTL